jgi:hypothetical protein
VVCYASECDVSIGISVDPSLPLFHEKWSNCWYHVMLKKVEKSKIFVIFFCMKVKFDPGQAVKWVTT